MRKLFRFLGDLELPMFSKDRYKYSTAKQAYDSMRNQYDPKFIYKVEYDEEGEYFYVTVSNIHGKFLSYYLEDY